MQSSDDAKKAIGIATSRSIRDIFEGEPSFGLEIRFDRPTASAAKTSSQKGPASRRLVSTVKSMANLPSSKAEKSRPACKIRC